MLFSLPLTLLLAIEASAQVASDVQLSASVTTGTSVSNLGGDLLPTGSDVSYLSYTTTSTLNGTTVIFQTTMAVGNASSSSSTSKHATSTSVTLLQGSMRSSSTTSNGTMTGNSTASRTSSTAVPTNTQACNNYPEFCSRKYSNITYVGAHNSPFVVPDNAASNQQLGVLDQLNDGIRMLETETHYNSTTSTVSCCHTSCDLLDVGTVQSYLTNITAWIKTHPYDVITILLSNSDFISVGNYSAPIVNSGLSNYAYVPSQVPMNTSSWPTLSEMILMGKRAVIFMDYNANQTEVPYILDEFSQMWETPFSPTNQSFPCTQQRPPGLSVQAAENRMYMANHNLNTEISLAGTSLLVPTTALINQTNALNGSGSLGLMANNCAATWPNPPNFLLVDYYNEGSSPGSVFEVAAQHNNVTYDRACCGLVQSAAHSLRPSGSLLITMLALGALVILAS
ncbi:hypothetical protein IMSHALPRED_000986 [Imshaugia aleurites]|uniref:PLC-like phosphodiesterase n=1 Tax=Imshaugia aleurites TaxID=172621 RepID=A0A8H3EZV9_9LECA|nr:hypothetical protein IMSHALPRED_000986 [Imshaugia aleurites]